MYSSSAYIYIYIYTYMYYKAEATAHLRTTPNLPTNITPTNVA